MSGHLGVALVHRLDPGGAAGCEQGQVFARFQTGLQLRGFFEDRQIGTGTGVIDFGKAEMAQRGDQAAHGILTARFAELFTECHTDRRSDLGNHPGSRFVEHAVDLLLMAAHRDRTGRADRGTLAAAGAATFGERFLEGRSNGQL